MSVMNDKIAKIMSTLIKIPPDTIEGHFNSTIILDTKIYKVTAQVTLADNGQIMQLQYNKEPEKGGEPRIKR